MATASISRLPDQPQYEAPIDLVRLAANTLGNRDLEIQVLRLFMTQSASAMSRLATENDSDVLKDIVHTLKGSARAVGAGAVAACCERLEGSGQAGVDADFNGLHEAVDQANAYIDDLLSA